MRVAIDVSGALGTKGGIHMYLQQLINQLPGVAPDIEYSLYAMFWDGFPEKFKNFQIPAGSRYEILLKRLPQKYVLYLENAWNIRVQERVLAKHKIDLFHGACQIVPPTKRMKTVVTVHHHDNPRYMFFNRWQKFYFKDVMERSARRADHLIADSKFTKRYLMEQLGLPAEKITVVYHGAPDIDPAAIRGEAVLSALKQRYGLQKPYALCVSHVNKRKNITGLIRAFRMALDQTKADLDLVIVGRIEENYGREVSAAIESSDLRSRVKLIGEVAPAEIPVFYGGALFFALPSFLEGFGIPLVEAMKFGCPVVTSNTTCIPEVVGAAALVVDPEKDEAIAGALTRVIQDDSLRRSLIEKGYQRAKDFSWRVAAERTVAVYRKVLS